MLLKTMFRILLYFLMHKCKYLLVPIKIGRVQARFSNQYDNGIDDGKSWLSLSDMWTRDIALLEA